MARIVVNTALRKLGVLASGREPRVADLTDTLEALRNMYHSWIASGAFGRIEDITPSGNTYIARGNERIYRDSAETLSVTLPNQVSEGWINDYGRRGYGYYGTTITIETVGNETTVTVEAASPQQYAVTPRDGSVVVISDRIGGQTQTWIYDGTVKKWERIDELDEDDDAPRSWADMQGLAACLALEVADDFGVEISAATARQANRFQNQLITRFGMRREEVCGEYF